MATPDEYVATANKIVISVMDSLTDKSGKKYYYHLKTVADNFTDYRYVCVALLHDLLEDTPYTEADLRKHFPDEIVDAVVAITRRDGEAYISEYIPRVKQNEIATAVKIADLIHNLDLSRLSSVEPIDIARNKKYLKALKKLTLEGAH